MNKKIMVIAVAAAIAAPMAASADATVYGKVRQAIEGFDNGAADNIRIRDWNSRLGVKGSEDLGNGLKGIYKMEFAVNISGKGNNADSGGNEFAAGGVKDFFGARNAYVGLAGDWGTFVIGRHDTPLKISTGSLDYFADTAGDNNNAYTENLADRRANGTIAYISPNMAGLTLAAALVPGENNNADGIADAYSVAALYSNSGFFGSLAYEAGDKDIDALGGAGDLTQWRVGLGYNGGDWKVGGVYENMNLDNAAGGPDIIDADKWEVSGAYNFGNNTVKAKYFDVSDDRNSAGDHDGFAIGLDHNFSKRTQVYAQYVDSSFDNAEDTTVWGIGLNHNF